MRKFLDDQKKKKKKKEARRTMARAAPDQPGATKGRLTATRTTTVAPGPRSFPLPNATRNASLCL